MGNLLVDEDGLTAVLDWELSTLGHPLADFSYQLMMYRMPDRIAVGLDVRGTTLAARGWTQEGGDLWETLARLDREGCARYVVTDVAKDGMLAGPNLQLLKDVCAATDAAVVASGGVTTRDDVIALRGLVAEGVEGAIIGSALYREAFTLTEALETAGRP